MLLNIKKLIEQLKRETIVQETEVRTKIMYPLLDLLNYKREYITDEFPVYAKDGSKDLKTKSADIMVFANKDANKYREKKNKDWVLNNSLIIIELKKPKEKIENAKDQATFYAMWTRSLIYIITNGIEIEIYQLKDYKADVLLFKDKIFNLEEKWNELYKVLYYDNLKTTKLTPQTPLKKITISSDLWEEVLFDEERDITDAIRGNKLFPYNVKSCPELPILSKLKEDIELTNYSIIRGVSGSGKSITAYQLAYYYFNKGYRVFKYINNNDSFDYNFKDLVNDKSVFIIDDLQNITNIYIDKIIAKTSENVKFICTITDDINVDVESTYISSTESIQAIKKAYLKSKDEIYKIVHKIDKDIEDKYLSETLESRLDKAEKDASSPWMFNYILRGGWNTAKNDYFRLKERNRADWLMIFLAMKQIALLDKSVGFNELNKILNFIDYDSKWIADSLKYMLKNKIIVEENNKYRCTHIKYASLIINKISHDLIKEEKDILIKIIHSIILDNNISLQGISWLLNEFRFHDIWYYQEYLITKEVWNNLKIRCFSPKNDIEIRNSCLLLDTLIRFYPNIKQQIFDEKIDLIVKWIEQINYTTGYALHNLVNELLDYNNNNSANNLLLKNNINFEKIAFQINNSNHKDLGAIGYFLNRLFIFQENEWKKKITDNLDYELLIEKINEKKFEVDIWGISVFNSSLFFLDNDKGKYLYDNIENIYTYNFNKDPLHTYEALDDELLWMFFGYSYFSEKKPKKEFRLRAKKLVSSINAKMLASKICESNRHDWERYARLIDWINKVDKNITKQIVKNIDYETLNINLEKYWKEPPCEMRLLLISLAESSRNKEPIKSWIENNIDKIETADPLLVYINPNVATKCYEKKLKIDIFGHNDSDELASYMLNMLEEINHSITIEAIKQSLPKIISKIESICPYIGFNDLEIFNLISLISKIDKSLLKEIFSSLNSEKTIKNWNRYNNEKGSNKNANKTLAILCKYAKEYNKSLRKYSLKILNKIDKKYKEII